MQEVAKTKEFNNSEMSSRVVNVTKGLGQNTAKNSASNTKEVTL